MLFWQGERAVYTIGSESDGIALFMATKALSEDAADRQGGSDHPANSF
jgi:hypothetical protein